MAEFKIIETQEQLDAIIGARLQRQAESIRGEYADYDQLKEQAQTSSAKIEELSNSLNEKDNLLASNATTIEELQAKVKAHETASVKTRILTENGLPLELANRLQGTTEEELRQDAETLKGIFKTNKTQPMFTPEHTHQGDNKDAELLKMIKGLRKGE